ncbi:MAG: glycerophosphodiester phosphodiesterase [Alistipes sp.]|nr:glycerophosphodiester phosphodiesterase [Candidatus Alistipes equi]
MKNFVFCVVAPALFSLLSCTSKDSINKEYDIIAETIQLNELDSEMATVRDYVPRYANIAHRGTTYWAPEETESSWRWARHMGTDYLEADIQCSKDKVLLAVHDNNFSRTTDIDTAFGANFLKLRRRFYGSFKNADGTQHFSNEDIEEQIHFDSLLGFERNARDYYYAEILMLDAGKWFNDANAERARKNFASDGLATHLTIKSKEDKIVYSNGQYVSALRDLLAFASGQILKRDKDGRRVLGYEIKEEFHNMTLRQIRERPLEKRGTNLDGKHYDSNSRYMDFVSYDFENAYCNDTIACENLPGVYIEFKESSLQPLDIVALTYLLLDFEGWNIITKPSMEKDFFKSGNVNVGKTNGKVILQTFRLEALEMVENVFKGKIPMCYLIDDEPPVDWDPSHYFDDPQSATLVIDYAVKHKCHIIGPSIDGEPNNYPNRCHPWQQTLIHRAGMLLHAWSIDSKHQMMEGMDAMFTNRTDLTLEWLIKHNLRPKELTVPSAEALLDKLGY